MSASVTCQQASAAFIRPVRSPRVMVVSAHPLASEAGLSVLRRGGNAVDAAVATAMAISVVEPFSAGIGGGGFLLLYLTPTKEMKALDFRERAPRKATRDMYLDRAGKVRPNASIDGRLSVAVPGTVAGLYELHRRYGKLKWEQVVRPAVVLARDGFPVNDRFVAYSKQRQQPLAANPAARQIFLKDGKPYAVGDLLVQKDLAATLASIARNPRSFYEGKIGQAIARDMAQNGGLITLEDLKAYKPTWRSPLCGPFRQYRVCSMPPPSSGGVHLLQMLQIIGDVDLKSLGWHHPDALHLMVEAMKIAYADRSYYLGDPDFVKVPVAALVSSAYAAKRREEISPSKARPSSEVKPIDREILERLERSQKSEVRSQKFKILSSPPLPLSPDESPDTTHLTVVDVQRNVVSLTFTINYRFGSGVVAPGTGILLNDEMDDFAIAPGVPNVFGLVGGEANAIAPKKIPLSSMTPTILTEKDRFRLATGAPGGSTIITTVLQIILNVAIYDMDAGAAVSAGRLHHQWLPEKLRVEPWAFEPATLEDLRRRGHEIEQQPEWGNANIVIQQPDGSLEGAADPRGEGAALGF
ncbi:MAG: gamma-glutamyltransferase [Cyanosarcina radialis HA8281-LM2]|nr:gamma-glutamyltransferase [Cyanosarcina radialis HA8281-LM2]